MVRIEAPVTGESHRQSLLPITCRHRARPRLYPYVRDVLSITNLLRKYRRSMCPLNTDSQNRSRYQTSTCCQQFDQDRADRKRAVDRANCQGTNRRRISQKYLRPSHICFPASSRYQMKMRSRRRRNHGQPKHYRPERRPKFCRCVIHWAPSEPVRCPAARALPGPLR